MSNFAINNNGRSLVAGLLGTVDIDLCLWENYKLMGDQLAIFDDADAPLISVEQKEHRRYTLKNLNELQNQIRQRPGFERFLLPPTEEKSWVWRKMVPSYALTSAISVVRHSW